MANMTAALRTARRLEERQAFDSECLITAEGDGFIDDDGVWQATTTTIYEGPCAFEPTSAVTTRTTESAGQVVEVHPYKIKVPQNTPALRGHAVKITACPEDTGAVGRSFTVEAVAFSQNQTTRVLGCEEAVA